MKKKLIFVSLVAIIAIALHVVGQRFATQAAIRDLDSEVNALAVSGITGVAMTLNSGFMTDDLLCTVYSANGAKTLRLSVTTLLFIPVSYIKDIPN